MKKLWKAKLDGRKWSFTKITEELLKYREIFDLDRFLYPTEEDFVPFENFENIKEAAKIVINGIKNNKSFFIYYDVDTDGLTAGAIMTRYLVNFDNGSTITPYINKGKEHGLNQNAPCFKEKYDIVIIVDAMQDDPFLYEELLRMGSEVVVLDHHDIPKSILLMQKRIHLVSSMNEYPNPYLSGAGVTLKFCLYLDSLMETDYAQEYYDLAACGICADMMNVGPEAMENRYICQRGFSNLKSVALAKIKGTYPFNSETVSFSVAPLVNAANRMDQNWDALNLFLTDDESEINDYIYNLKQCRERQNGKIEKVYSQIEKQIEEQKDNKVMFFVLKDADNISGLVANRVLEELKRPVIITQERTDENGEIVYSGSLRATGVEDFSKMVNKTECGKAMGHSNAAGFTVTKANKEKFQKRIEQQLENVEFVQEAAADIKLLQNQVNQELINWFQTINKISGQGFPPLKVLIEDVVDYEVGSMSDGKHTKITTKTMMFIKWNSRDWENIPHEASLSMIGKLDSGYIGRKYYWKMIMDDYKVEDRIDIDDI